MNYENDPRHEHGGSNKMIGCFACDMLSGLPPVVRWVNDMPMFGTDTFDPSDAIPADGTVSYCRDCGGTVTCFDGLWTDIEDYYVCHITGVMHRPTPDELGVWFASPEGGE